VASKVDRGDVGRDTPLVTQDIRDKFAMKWHETMTKKFGLASYNDLALELWNCNPVA
jgi:hypothetical protein